MDAADPANLYGNLDLSDFLCFAVYSANLAFGRAYQPILEPLGLTYTQYVALIALSEGENLTVSALAEKLFLESNTVTPMLKKLERMGFVERRRDASDERIVRVTLTDKGRMLRESRPEEALSEVLGLEPGEFKQLQSAIVKLRRNIAGRREKAK